MTNCPYCNPDPRVQKTVTPVVDNDELTICLIAHTPIGNRKQKGRMQIYCNRTEELIYADLEKCPVCGQYLYN